MFFTPQVSKLTHSLFSLPLLYGPESQIKVRSKCPVGPTIFYFYMGVHKGISIGVQTEVGVY